ncbi:MAG: cellulase family glycosylhydrolase, partial [Halococcoides sp.]
MTHDTTPDSTDATGESAGVPATRRSVLKAAGAAAAGGLLGAGLTTTVSASSVAAAPPRLERKSRDSNLIVDPQGNRVTLRGVNIVDPYRAARDAPYYKYRGERTTQMATNHENGWYANVIRVPMQPNDIARQGAGSVEPGAYTQAQLDSYIRKYVDPIVEECAYQGVYVILDYHRHWPDGPDWTQSDLDAEITNFWNTVAPRYAEQDHVIYEVYNEPTTPYNGAGCMRDCPALTDPSSEETWLRWRETAQPWVDTIRQHASNLAIIGSPRWSQWTYWAANSKEFDGKNLGYVGHVYTQEGLRPLSKYFGEPSTEVPVFITEFGFGGSGSHMNGTREVHGPEFRNFFETYDAAHPIAWCFDFDWGPAMLNRSYEVATEWGDWVKTFLAEHYGTYAPSEEYPNVSPPATPSDLSLVEKADTAVKIDWTPVEGADGYNVYATQALLGQVSGPPIVVGGLTPSSQAWIGVTAYNEGGSSSYVEIPEINLLGEGEGPDLTPDIGGGVEPTPTEQTPTPTDETPT